MMRTYMSESVDKIWLAGKSAIAAFAADDEQTILMMGLKRFTKAPLVNTKALRREIADQMIDAGNYSF